MTNVTTALTELTLNCFYGTPTASYKEAQDGVFALFLLAAKVSPSFVATFSAASKAQMNGTATLLINPPSIYNKVAYPGRTFSGELCFWGQ